MARRRRIEYRTDRRSRRERLVPESKRHVVLFQRPVVSGSLDLPRRRQPVRVVVRAPVMAARVAVRSPFVSRILVVRGAPRVGVSRSIRDRVCRDRGVRREVMFAKRVAGAGGARRSYKWTVRSNVRC